MYAFYASAKLFYWLLWFVKWKRPLNYRQIYAVKKLVIRRIPTKPFWFFCQYSIKSGLYVDKNSKLQMFILCIRLPIYRNNRLWNEGLVFNPFHSIASLLRFNFRMWLICIRSLKHIFINQKLMWLEQMYKQRTPFFHRRYYVVCSRGYSYGPFNFT